jgi:hypothetical protein
LNSGLTVIQDMQQKFHFLELRYREIYEWIPYNKNNLDVYSPKISSFITDVGPQILGMFDFLCKQFGLTSQKNDFPGYFTILNQSHMLSIQGFLVPQKSQLFNPFDFQGNVPSWWNAWNKIKHEQPTGEIFGILENAILCFGALFILHHIGDLLTHPYNKPTFNFPDSIDSTNWFRVQTEEDYVKYSENGNSSSKLYSSFLSPFFGMSHRFLPNLQGKSISLPN